MLRRSRTPAPSTTGVGVTISAMVRSVLMAEVLRPPCAAARPHPWPCLGGSALLAREPLRRERDAVADAEREDVPVDERLERAVVEADGDLVQALLALALARRRADHRAADRARHGVGGGTPSEEDPSDDRAGHRAGGRIALLRLDRLADRLDPPVAGPPWSIRVAPRHRPGRGRDASAEQQGGDDEQRDERAGLHAPPVLHSADQEAGAGTSVGSTSSAESVGGVRVAARHTVTRPAAGPPAATHIPTCRQAVEGGARWRGRRRSRGRRSW